MDFIHAIEAEIGKKAVIEMMPMQAGDVKKTWADVSHLGEDFKYKPGCSVEKGIRNFVSWYKSFYKQ